MFICHEVWCTYVVMPHSYATWLIHTRLLMTNRHLTWLVHLSRTRLARSPVTNPPPTMPHTLQHTTTHIATYCNTHCNTLQHTWDDAVELLPARVECVVRWWHALFDIPSHVCLSCGQMRHSFCVSWTLFVCKLDLLCLLDSFWVYVGLLCVCVGVFVCVCGTLFCVCWRHALYGIKTDD